MVNPYDEKTVYSLKNHPVANAFGCMGTERSKKKDKNNRCSRWQKLMVRRTEEQKLDGCGNARHFSEQLAVSQPFCENQNKAADKHEVQINPGNGYTVLQQK
jgi:hypothetical protein